MTTQQRRRGKTPNATTAADTTQAAAEAPATRDLTAGGTASPPGSNGAAEKPDCRDIVAVQVRVYQGSLTRIKVPIAVIARYERIPLAGPAREFDHLLDYWLTRAIDLGMIGSKVGELFPVHLLRSSREKAAVSADVLLLVGMGEPGYFGRDDLSYLISNVTVAVKTMGHDEFATSLIGSRRNELSVERAVRGLLEGILEGYDRFRAALVGVKDNRERLVQAAAKGLIVSVVEKDKSRVQEIVDVLKKYRDMGDVFPGLQLEFSREDPLPGPADGTPEPPDVAPENEKMTLLQVSRTTTRMGKAGKGGGTAETFQFSALGESSAIPVREVKLNSYFARQLPARLSKAPDEAAQAAFGTFFTQYLVPEEFRPLAERDEQLTLVLDASTASYPWEMAAFKNRDATQYLGISRQLARQFRSLSSGSVGVPPPLNEQLRVLVIADPAPGGLSLPGARREALAVVKAMSKAKASWKDTFKLLATVRVGSCEEPGAVAGQLDEIRQYVDVIEGPQGVKPCDPLELVMLLVNGGYDVVHFAGHGVFDAEGGRMGWVFDRDCVLSAHEIFRVRQVPRLVFANACLSAVTEEHERQQQVGLAQAFFARGIQNYIGTGWQVDDDLAVEFATRFYTQVLGTNAKTAPPATLGASIQQARIAARNKGFELKRGATTWGAYQHYGRANDKLLPVPNRPGSEDE